MNETIIKEMVREGVVFGHKRSKTHPKMRPFISGTKNEIELINPESSYDSLTRATAFLKEKKAQGGLFLLVGTRPAAKKTIVEFAAAFQFPYVISRWLGGTITNFNVIRKRIAYYEELQEKKAKGDFEKYTKKEQRGFTDQIQKMRENFDGLRPLTRKPDILFFIDANAHETAIREARKAGVPTVGILDTNDNPAVVDYPIIANDHSAKSVQWIVNFIVEELKK